eukprot:GHVS01064805.1.p1 GENE.GHVS01064805.1~~GHVS01064805.1.p1  ORF type:complete len:164 (-),score=6.87 GHVS01064805.1:543-1034(-)
MDPPLPGSSDTHSGGNSYEDFAKDSLRAASVEHGLQYNAIYWETGHKTYTSILQPLTQKFSWHLIDDQIRRVLGFHKNVSSEPFVFYGPDAYFRNYHGNASVNEMASLKVRSNFCFFPTGMLDLNEVERKAGKLTGADAFAEVIRSAFKVDYQTVLDRGSPTS